MVVAVVAAAGAGDNDDAGLDDFPGMGGAEELGS